MMLYQLGVSIAAMRQILLNGTAGHIIYGFGNLFMGGGFIFGAVIFLLVVFVQFTMIKKCFTCITEVAVCSKYKFNAVMKLLRGEAIAGIAIMAITTIGGVILGLTQMDMTTGDAMQRFSLLAIGNYVVSQIPALLLFPTLLLSIMRIKSVQNESAHSIG